jgi:hypothetical protein
MFSFLRKTFNILKVGFVSRIYMNAIACMCLGLSIGTPSTIFKFVFVVAGALILAETWFQFGFRRATVINALKK